MKAIAITSLLGVPYSFAFVLLATACGPPLVGVQAGLSTSQRDDLQRGMPRPPIEQTAVYEIAAAETDVPVSLAAFSAWFEKSGIGSLHSFSVGTASVFPISQVQDLTGSWSRVGDRRRVVFADGNTAVQEIVDLRPLVLEYVDWNLTNHAGRYLRYVVEQIAFWRKGSGTHVRWTSSFRPRPFPDNVMIESYVREDYAEYLRGAIAAMRTHALDDIATAAGATSTR